MGLLVTHLGTDAGGTDDGEQGVSLWPHRHLNSREDLWEFVLVFVCWSNCVYKHLETSETRA